MSDRGKKIFLAICILVPFILYSAYYYSMMVKNAPYRFADFESITFKYGLGDSLINMYESKTGNYQFVNTQDSLIKTNVKLRKDDLLYLHRKAAELGFWNFPAELQADNRKPNSPRYFIEYRYKEKTKSVTFDAGYQGDPKLASAVRSLITEVDNMINDARER